MVGLVLQGSLCIGFNSLWFQCLILWSSNIWMFVLLKHLYYSCKAFAGDIDLYMQIVKLSSFLRKIVSSSFYFFVFEYCLCCRTWSLLKVEDAFLKSQLSGITSYHGIQWDKGGSWSWEGFLNLFFPQKGERNLRKYTLQFSYINSNQSF